MVVPEVKRVGKRLKRMRTVIDDATQALDGLKVHWMEKVQG